MLTFLDAGGGGGGFPAARLTTEEGFANGFGGTFFKLANGLGTAGAESTDGKIGGLPPGIGGAGIEGGRGAAARGGREKGVCVVSESE